MEEKEPRTFIRRLAKATRSTAQRDLGGRTDIYSSLLCHVFVSLSIFISLSFPLLSLFFRNYLRLTSVSLSLFLCKSTVIRHCGLTACKPDRGIYRPPAKVSSSTDHVITQASSIPSSEFSRKIPRPRWFRAPRHRGRKSGSEETRETYNRATGRSKPYNVLANSRIHGGPTFLFFLPSRIPSLRQSGYPSSENKRSRRVTGFSFRNLHESRYCRRFFRSSSVCTIFSVTTRRTRAGRRLFQRDDASHYC